MKTCILPLTPGLVAVAALAAACTATPRGTFTSGGASGGAGGSPGNTSGTSTSGGPGVGGGVFVASAGSGGSVGAGPGVPCNVVDPTKDMDGDGWTPAEGDCNDCDPDVNPGAVDTPAHAGPDGGTVPAADNDCNGKLDLDVTCDASLALDDVDPMDGAKAIELCQAATELGKTWGVIKASYVRANGTAYTPGTEVGIQTGFGPNVHVQGGKSLLALSSGHARLPGQAGACGKISCSNNGSGVAPVGFPQNIPACVPATQIADDEALELEIRAPSNATGYTFNFKFHSFEYPTWTCTDYNDQFVTLVSPAPTGSLNGNVSFDANKNPVSVNLAFFEVCDPASASSFASKCKSKGSASCPALPSPYCPSGLGELQGTGFDTWGGGTVTNGGATSWLETTAPVKGSSTFTIRFAIWDTGNSQYDSTVLVDNFQWIATGGAIATTTTPVGVPK